jgi:hypothetical protein
MSHDRRFILMAYDEFLQLLIGGAERLGIGYPITLNVGGVLVTGNLIGSRTYFKGVAPLMAGIAKTVTKEGATLADVKTIEESLLSGNLGGSRVEIRAADEAAPSDANAATDSLDVYDFIHLQDAHFYSPSGTPWTGQKPGIWWRGQVSSIGGFIFGVITPEIA